MDFAVPQGSAAAMLDLWLQCWDPVGVSGGRCAPGSSSEDAGSCGSSTLLVSVSQVPPSLNGYVLSRTAGRLLHLRDRRVCCKADQSSSLKQ